MDNSQRRLFPGQKAPGRTRRGRSLCVPTILTKTSRGNFEQSGDREPPARSASHRIVVPGALSTFSSSLPWPHFTKAVCTAPDSQAIDSSPRKSTVATRSIQHTMGCLRARPASETMGRERKSYLCPGAHSSRPGVPPDTNSQDRPSSNLDPPTPQA